MDVSTVNKKKHAGEALSKFPLIILIEFDYSKLTQQCGRDLRIATSSILFFVVLCKIPCFHQVDSQHQNGTTTHLSSTPRRKGNVTSSSGSSFLASTITTGSSVVTASTTIASSYTTPPNTTMAATRTSSTTLLDTSTRRSISQKIPFKTPPWLLLPSKKK